jgi:hypothetical protein
MVRISHDVSSPVLHHDAFHSDNTNAGGSGLESRRDSPQNTRVGNSTRFTLATKGVDLTVRNASLATHY